VQWRWRQVRRLLRWHWVLFPLLAAAAAGTVTALLASRGGNQWCSGSQFTCSMDTSVLGVVLIGGVTSYWYYGLRRAMLLARHQRTVLARLRSASPAAGGRPAGHDAHDMTVIAVLSRYRDWRHQAPLMVVTGLPVRARPVPGRAGTAVSGFSQLAGPGPARRHSWRW
jgi:hypothetical protein